MNFYQSPQSINLVFDLIGRVPSGRTILNIFIKQYSKKVEITPYPDRLLKRLRIELQEGQPVGACFIHDGETGTIHYDPRAELGILAPFLVHELSHATDSDLWTLTQYQEGSAIRKTILIQAELKAFQLQQKFIKELKKIDRQYLQFIEFAQQRIRILADNFLESEIKDLYKF